MCSEETEIGMTFARDSRYDALSMALHWLSAALVLIALALIEMKGVFGKGGGRDLVKLLHYQAGALVVMVTVFRLGWCAVRHAPKAPAAPGGVEEYVGRMVHWGLYAALLAVPVAGVVALLAAGKPTILLGIDLPVWIDGRGKPPRGTVFIPFFDETVMVNDLTLDAVDPFSKQPDYKKSAVRISKAAS
jgi:cytochrome b561